MMALDFDFKCEKCGKPYTTTYLNPEDVVVWRFGSNFEVQRRIRLCPNCRYKILEFISTPEKEEV